MLVFTDASVKNHNGAGIGWHIQTWGDDQNTLLKTIDKGYDFVSDNYTSEEAELLAITRGIKEALRNGERSNLRLRTDCKPLVSKIENRENIADGQFMDSLYKLLEYVEYWDIRWIPRERNSIADRQAVVGRDQQT